MRGERKITMECREVLGYLSPYLDGELEPGLAGVVQGHLKECAGCRSELEGLRQADAWIRAMPVPAAGPELTERILSAARGGRSVMKPAAGRRGLLGMLESFFDTMRPRRTYSTGSLDAFNDSPPYSLGQILLAMIESQPRVQTCRQHHS